MTLYAYGITAIAPNSENLFVTDSQLQKLKSRFKQIFVFYDNDLAGIQNMNKIKKAHPELSFLYIPRSYEAKDISDFRKKYGHKKTEQLISDAKEKLLWRKNDQDHTTEQEDIEQNNEW